MEDRPRTLRLALSTVWPGLRYLGLGVWVAWLFLISSGSIWLSDVEADGFYLANLMLLMTVSSAVVCLAAPYAQRIYGMLLARRRVLMGVASLASLGALGVIAAGPYYLGTSFDTAWIFWPSIVLMGVFSGAFSLKCGQLFGGMEPRRVMLYTLLSEMTMVALSYFVLGNNIFSPVQGGPPLSGIAGFALLPLLAAYLVCLPAEGVPDAPAPCSPLRDLPPAFLRFLVVIFVFTVVSETVRCYFVFVRMPSLTYLDSIVVLLLRTLFAVLMLAFALRSHKRLYFSRMYLFSLVAIAVAMALIPLLQIYNTVLGGIIGFASNVLVLLIWCLLAGVTFEKRIPAIVVFGFGRGALLVGQACGWLLGIWLLPQLAGTRWEIVCYVGVAIVILVMVTLFFSERQFDRLFGEIAKAQISLDLSSSFGSGDRKKHRPWHEACRRAGEQAMLSSREQEIFELLVVGRSPDNIAAHLVLSLHTVRTHIRNIYGKFDVHNKAELVSYVEAILNEKDGRKQ
ncbi:MAG: helix-turn-helix transcriptional regulator [Coriobacteriales bacterium]|jgi:DNA-binding CsgD family transcriptional regulator|nr:helix-turn-helix transcriptional regulator [Coriobacteriales bacterium]